MKLTRVMKKKHIEEAGNVCPYCNSKNIMGHGLIHYDMCICQDVACGSCGKSWRDIYTLIDVIEEI